MTVLLFDASADLRLRTPRSETDVPVDELVYADDTMVVAFSASRAEVYMDCIAQAGGDYGLCFNWRKVEAMHIRCVLNVLKPDGHPVACKSSLVYLGNLLDNAGDIGPELNRRLGSARADFQALNRVWKHACIAVKNLRSLLDLFPWKNTVTTNTADSCKSFSLSLSQTVTECGRVHTQVWKRIQTNELAYWALTTQRFTE